MLKRVSIQNFKSLKNVELNLQKVNLLIGPNNSGKTNFLKALEFYGDFARKQVSINSNLTFKKNPEELLSFQLTFEGSSKWVSTKTKYTHLTLESNSDKSYSQFVSGSDDFEVTTYAQSVNYSVWQDLTGAPIIYKPDPNKLDKPGPVGIGEDIVSADASNLVGFLDLMLSKHRRTIFNQIEIDLHQCISEFDEIKLDDVIPTDELKKLYSDDKSKNSFKQFGLANGKQNITYWADELSEGTLYFLALLCIINQPNPPKLLLLEEPEKGIHPRRIDEVVNFIFRLADDKDIQVIMTTHSPIVLDLFKDIPECVHIFEKNNDEGATQVKNLYTDVIEPDTKRSEELGIEPPHYTDSLGDSWTVGFLGGVPK